MAVVGISRICVHHPERAGFATCMSCRQVVCQECATTRDGINYCRPCLGVLHQTAGETGRWRIVAAQFTQLVVMVALFIVTAWLMTWALATIAGWQ